MSEFKVGLTPDEKKLFSQLFRSLDTEKTGIITGEKARSTFEKSGLPPTTLGEIWQLADQQNLGFLNQFSFCYAMRLIGYTQAGHQPTPGLGDYPGPLPKFINLSLPPPSLQPQSTNSSFMKSQTGPLSPTQQQGTLSDYVAPVGQQDYNNFSQLFLKTVGSPQGELNGVDARNIFLKTKLSSNVLEQIWYLVDIKNSGKLDLPSFVVAMHLIQGLLSGNIKQLPPILSNDVWDSVNHGTSSLGVPAQQNRQISQASINSQQTTVRHASGASQISQQAPSSSDWVITPTMKQQYDSIFDNIDKEKTGHLNAEQVASFLMTSKLNQQDLATVWDLSDIQNTGIFTKVEFSIALFLVNKKLAGGKLPNIVPSSLLESLQPQTNAVPEPKAIPPVQQPVQQISKQKTAMDDLVDIFGTSAPAPVALAPTSIPTLEQRATSSSDLTSSTELPKIRSALTGSFKPTSTFGQSLVQKQTEVKHDNLLVPQQIQTSTPVETPPIASPTKQINYEALRSVPPPPSKRAVPPPTAPSYAQSVSSGPTPSSTYSEPVSRSVDTYANEDLLAETDPEISGQLSQANADIANVSNQIRSLATQTTNLHEKKIRAEQELQRILTTKVEIENKLKQLRSSYDNEVKQVSQVESNLAAAKEETEALRSQASISEAKFNALSSELNSKQLAVEELQKQNNSLKEKLGYMNAEIVQLEQDVTKKSADHQGLYNQVSVKKSQVQVAIVKSEELKNKIKEIEDSHSKLQAELDQAHIKSKELELEHSTLNDKVQETLSKKPTQPTPGLSAKNIVGGAAAGSIIGGVAAAVLHHTSSEEAETQPTSQIPEPASEQAPVEEEQAPETTNEENEEDANRDLEEDKSYPEINVEDINQKYPDISNNERGIDNVTNATATSSIATDYKATEENETPVTSPSNSDFQFPQGANPGIVGGMVGMPGVLVGVQRTDSLTSSVQNNAALSVRDDNIDEISDRDTIENSNLEESEDPVPDSVATESYGIDNEDELQEPSHVGHEDNSDGDKLSSGVESFEIVNADEARAQEAQYASQGGSDSVDKTPNDEFPAIKELDYEESDSSSETASQEENFDDAVTDLPHSDSPPKYEERVKAPVTEAESVPAPAPKFDDFFNDLEPTTQEQAQPDLFGDDFSNLEAAKDDNDDEEFGKKDFGFDEGFTGGPSPAVNFSAPVTANESSAGNDEWEQLFAGFGNSAPVENSESHATDTVSVPTASESLSGSNDGAVQELVGMGFSESTALAALEKSNWNLEEATNYLLDNA
ncbi:hypothetical protein DFJ63DRAFT_286250 [Scheffersomyces coipomensis]|uniref:uncharacterized protein n=1 Tax=Scheffersomyces coipomensis TaxID=1788519 RepID=UPI00315CB26A